MEYISFYRPYTDKITQEDRQNALQLLFLNRKWSNYFLPNVHIQFEFFKKTTCNQTICQLSQPEFVGLSFFFLVRGRAMNWNYERNHVSLFINTC